ncbi:hypothetical protein MsAg5_16010 [Methanosarcinaceae archaeon Ag5]|uniref:Uncharacterized protein n=1 Tax=Methanolapillus africanus TaxID=3028297 RepID=A0AAE4MJE8_9EURY|nr:hypothetical protein [Methanosarcinaceae archaeon Ag5]
MKLTKILILALVAMLVLTVAPMAMAGNGNDQGGNNNNQGGNNNNQGNGNNSTGANPVTGGSNTVAAKGTAANPYKILYLGWSWNGTNWTTGLPDSGKSMGFYTGATQHGVSTYNFSYNGIYYTHVYCDFDSWNTTVIPASFYDSSVMGQDYDLYIGDMFYSSYYNGLNTNYLNAMDAEFNGSSTFTASVFASYNNQTWAPSYFDYKDTLALTPNASDDAEWFDECLTLSGATAESAAWSQYLVLIDGYFN